MERSQTRKARVPDIIVHVESREDSPQGGGSFHY